MTKYGMNNDNNGNVRSICIIGPYKTDIGGNAKAIDSFIRGISKDNQIKYCVVDLAGKSRNESRSQKIIKTLKKLREIVNFSRNNIDYYYITIAQKGLRDVLFLSHIYLLKKKSAKVILHLHGGSLQKEFQASNLFVRYLVKTYLGKADAGIVLGESLRCMFHEILPDDKIHVVMNCVDNEFVLDKNEMENKTARSASDHIYTVLYLSSMVKTKGFMDVVISAERLKAKGRIVKFVFCGPFFTEKDELEFRHFVHEHALDDIISYVGSVSGMKKRSQLKNADIFVLPTYYREEGQPISILEAMANCMPIITTDQGGICDIFKDGVNGVMVEKQSPSSIVDAIEYLISRPDVINRIGVSNWKEVVEKYSEEQYTKNLLKVIYGTQIVTE